MSVAIRPVRLEDAEGHNACVGVVARERRYLGMIDAPLLADSIGFVENILARDGPLFVPRQSVRRAAASSAGATSAS